MSKTFTREEVAKHNKEGDLWTVIDTAVYDLSKFVDMHPGGAYALTAQNVAGKDSTASFFGLHRSDILTKYKRLKIGNIEGEKSVVVLPIKGELSTVPHAEPMWLSKGFSSPYYTDKHRALQKWMRAFVDEHITPEAQAHEESGERPTVELIQKCGETYINHMRMGPGKHLHGLMLPGGIKGEEFDYFAELVVTQELVRFAARGYGDGFNGGVVIGLPPVMNFGSEEMKRKIVPDVLAGKKFICLAISEAYAGSDVAGLQTTAVKSADGKTWTINGSKKWITGGRWSDYFTVGCRTGKGLTVFLVERGEGVETKQIKTSYSTAAGTAYITFDNVVVPASNMLGKENKGLQVILSNFNHERWVMACGNARASRLCVEECMKWVNLRHAFGKPLSNQAVIRSHLADMIAKTEAVQALLESVTHQMCHMNYAQQSDLLAGHIGFLKAFATRSNGQIVEQAVQLFGGRALTKSNMGKVIEGMQRTHRFDALLGGAEDVLADLGVRQALRKMPMAAL